MLGIARVQGKQRWIRRRFESALILVAERLVQESGHPTSPTSMCVLMQTIAVSNL